MVSSYFISKQTSQNCDQSYTFVPYKFDDHDFTMNSSTVTNNTTSGLLTLVAPISFEIILDDTFGHQGPDSNLGAYF